MLAHEDLDALFPGAPQPHLTSGSRRGIGAQGDRTARSAGRPAVPGGGDHLPRTGVPERVLDPHAVDDLPIAEILAQQRQGPLRPLNAVLPLVEVDEALLAPGPAIRAADAHPREECFGRRVRVSPWSVEVAPVRCRRGAQRLHEVARFHVIPVDGELVVVVVHEDVICEWPLRGQGRAVWRGLLLAGDEMET